MLCSGGRSRSSVRPIPLDYPVLVRPEAFGARPALSAGSADSRLLLNLGQGDAEDNPRPVGCPVLWSWPRLGVVDVRTCAGGLRGAPRRRGSSRRARSNRARLFGLLLDIWEGSAPPPPACSSWAVAAGVPGRSSPPQCGRCRMCPNCPDLDERPDRAGGGGPRSAVPSLGRDLASARGPWALGTFVICGPSAFAGKFLGDFWIYLTPGKPYLWPDNVRELDRIICCTPRCEPLAWADHQDSS